MSDALTEAFAQVDLSRVPSPCHVLHRGLLEQNLRILRSVMDRSGAKVLLALKGFAQFSEAKLVSKYLAGTTASGLHEALLGREEFGGEVHAYSPAFKDEEFARLLRVADHVSFNSPAQWKRHKAAGLAAGRFHGGCQAGLITREQKFTQGLALNGSLFVPGIVCAFTGERFVLEIKLEGFVVEHFFIGRFGEHQTQRVFQHLAVGITHDIQRARGIDALGGGNAQAGATRDLQKAA